MINLPAWIQVNLDHLKYNINKIKKYTKNTPLMAVIKGDAYGHGAIYTARELQSLKISYLAVANLDEALELRKNKIKMPVLMLQPPFACQIETLIKGNIALTASSGKNIKDIIKAALKINKTARVHLKIDTGMGRIGFSHNPEKITELIKKIKKNRNIILEGIYTHLATTPQDDFKFMKTQWRRFQEIIKLLKGENVKIKYAHVSNSAGVIGCPRMKSNMIRPGIMIYGLYPFYSLKNKIKLKPVLSFKARISFLKKMDEIKSSISYGRTYFAKKEEIIATVPVGYADGVWRALSNKFYVLFRGKSVPIAGRICMDQFMINVTGFKNVRIGEEVVIIGKQKNNEISVDDWAGFLKTINYEVVAALSKRLPKVYIKNNKIHRIKTIY